MEGNHTENYANCASCQRANDYLELCGDNEVTRLFDHVGKVKEGKSYQKAVDKVPEGI